MTTYNVYKTNHPKLPHDVLSMYYLGFLGGKILSSTKIIITYQEGEKLRDNYRTEKEYHKNHSTKRMVVEFVIPCHLQEKKYWIMNDVFRNKLRKYDGVSDIVSGLVSTR